MTFSRLCCAWPECPCRVPTERGGRAPKPDCIPTRCLTTNVWDIGRNTGSLAGTNGQPESDIASTFGISPKLFQNPESRALDPPLRRRVTIGMHLSYPRLQELPCIFRVTDDESSMDFLVVEVKVAFLSKFTNPTGWVPGAISWFVFNWNCP